MNPKKTIGLFFFLSVPIVFWMSVVVRLDLSNQTEALAAVIAFLSLVFGWFESINSKIEEFLDCYEPFSTWSERQRDLLARRIRERKRQVSVRHRYALLAAFAGTLSSVLLYFLPRYVDLFAVIGFSCITFEVVFLAVSQRQREKISDELTKFRQDLDESNRRAEELARWDT